MRINFGKLRGTLALAGLLGLAGCSGGGKKSEPDPVETAASCNVQVNGDGTSTVSCSDGTSATVASGASDNAACTVQGNGNGTATVTCGGSSTTVSLRQDS